MSLSRVRGSNLEAFEVIFLCVFGSFLATLCRVFTVQDCALLRCCHDTYLESFVCRQLIECQEKKKDAFFWLNEFYLLVKSKPLHKCFYISSVNAAISTELSEPVIMCFNFKSFHYYRIYFSFN